MQLATYRTELAARLRAVTDDIAWIARGTSEDQGHYKPADYEWSLHEHLSHLRDMEQEVYLPLLRWATVPHMLDPLDYSRRDWHDKRYKPLEPIGSIINDIQRIRDEELAIFRTMNDQTWTKFREDTRWGPLTCQWVAELMYRHALDHMQGMMALKQDLNLATLQPPPLIVGGYIGGRT